MSSYTSTHPSTSGSFYDRNWRWFVLGTLFLATFLCYFDRQTLGTAIDPIAKEFGLDNLQRGELLSAFVFSYAFCLLFIGFLTDRIRNIRLFFPLMLLGWSASTILIGFSKSYDQIYWLRVLLGVWESVNFPICILIIGRIFPPVERSLAAGIFASGAFLATIAAPPFVIYFSNHHNWRLSFIVAGLMGLLWLIPWLIIFRHPERRAPQWSQRVLNHRDSKNPSGNTGILESLGSVVRQPGFWGIALMGLCIVPSLYFATQWFPSFFTQQLRQPFDQALAWKLSSIYLMQDVGLVLGGWMVLRLSQRGMAILKARKGVITSAIFLMLTVVIVPQLQSAVLCTVLLSLYVCGIGAFLGSQHALKQDVDIRQIATVSALVGGIETGFAAFVIKRVGLITNETSDFGPVFFTLAGLAVAGLVIVHIFLKKKWYRVE